MMNNENLEQKAISNVSWQLSEKLLTQFISFVVSIFIARLLEPSAYGIVALITPLISFFSYFCDCGLSMALIQKKEVTDVDYSTVFYINLLICLAIYILIFLVAPIISNFYELPNLVNLIRVSAIGVIFAAFQNVQYAYVARNLIFKKYFYASLLGTIVGGVIGIYTAFLGFGPWALVLNNVSNLFIDTVLIWVAIKWRPILAFSKQSFTQLFCYGSKIFVSGCVSILTSDVYSFIIGKISDLSRLAYYEKANSITLKIVFNISNSIENVLVSVLARYQDDILKIKEVAKKALKISGYVISPILLGVVAVSGNLISVVLTDKWLGMQPYLILLCIEGIFIPVNMVNVSCILAIGRSDINLKINVIKESLFLIVSIAILIRYGVLAMVFSFVPLSLFNQIINGRVNSKLINYSFFEQMKDLLPIWFISIVMCLIAYGFSYIDISSKLIVLVIQVAAGVVSYVCLSKIFKIKELDYLVQIVLEKIKK